MRILQTTIGIVLFASGLAAQGIPASIEITTTDITKLERIRSTDLTLFGIAIGDTTEAAQGKVTAAGFRAELVEAPQADGNRFTRVFDGANKEIFGFTDDGGSVEGLTLRDQLSARLPGDSARLLHASIMAAESPLRLRLLGREDSRTVERARGASITTIKISYDKEGIRLNQSYIEGTGNLPVTLHVVRPARPR